MTDREFALLMMDVADRAYLTTIGEDGFPRTRAMLNLRNPSLYPKQVELFAPHRKDLRVHMSSSPESAKARQIERNPHGCVYYCHPTRWLGVALIGDLEVTRDADLRRAMWNDGWEIYYPKGIDDPDYAVLTLRPRRVEGWTSEGRFEFAVERA
jgi:general stress protein 26